MGRKLIIGFGTICLVLGAIALWNYSSLYRPVTESLSDDPRNEGVEVIVHYQWFVNPNVIVFDLRSVSENNSPADVTRNLLQASKVLERRSFDHVLLSHRGTAKFILEGDFFKKLGTEYGVQNPMYTLRSLPENVLELDGTPAFGKWSGGWLGVTSKQIEDLNEFHREWFLSDLM